MSHVSGNVIENPKPLFVYVRPLTVPFGTADVATEIVAVLGVVAVLRGDTVRFACAVETETETAIKVRTNKILIINKTNRAAAYRDLREDT